MKEWTSFKKDKDMICFGLGVTDPKRIFGTTNNLVEKYGSKRVFDVPNSENVIQEYQLELHYMV